MEKESANLNEKVRLFICISGFDGGIAFVRYTLKGEAIKAQERYIMLAGIIILGYVLGVFLLLRFFQMVHQCDEDIEAMTKDPMQVPNGKKYRPAA